MTHQSAYIYTTDFAYWFDEVMHVKIMQLQHILHYKKLANCSAISVKSLINTLTLSSLMKNTA